MNTHGMTPKELQRHFSLLAASIHGENDRQTAVLQSGIETARQEALTAVDDPSAFLEPPPRWTAQVRLRAQLSAANGGHR